ncbi:MAG TPA: hypothetical protein VKP13_01085, partial [Nitrospira sp.]|nr:hypothetical protein [Nitrospira sp.]
FEAVVPGHWFARLKFGACEQIADLLKGGAILQGKTHQTGNDIVETDQLGRTVDPFQTQEDLGRVLVIMNADIGRALTSDFDFLCDVLTTGRERKPLAHDVSSSSETTSRPGRSDESESWLRLVADLRIICRVLLRSAERSA